MSDEKELQKYMDKYWTKPSVFGSVEPFCLKFAMDPTYGGYNISKSAYQNRPDIFNLEWLSKETGIEEDEVEERIQRMIDKHLIMLVQNPNTYAMGWAIYYWLVDLKDNATEDQKQEVLDHIQNEDCTCSAMVGEGDFDFYGGNHVGNLDFLRNVIIKPIEDYPQVKDVYITPVARYLREEKVAQWRAPEGTTRKFYISEEEKEKLAEVQDYMDEKDVEIFCALNKKRPVEDMFDFDVMEEISGIDASELQKNLKEYVEEKPLMIPLVCLNWRKLGLTKRYFVIRMYRMLPTEQKFAVADSLSEYPEWETLWQFTQTPYDFICSAYNELTDVDELRDKLMDIEGIEEIREFDVYRATRRWTCRLDEENDFWEECVMTTDVGIDSVNELEKKMFTEREFDLEDWGE
ncbi:MAG: AsnC family transcriptional regulator [Thermoplasmatota archaeon]